MHGEHLVDEKQTQQLAGQQPPFNFKSRAGVGWLGGVLPCFAEVYAWFQVALAFFCFEFMYKCSFNTWNIKISYCNAVSLYGSK